MIICIVCGKEIGCNPTFYDDTYGKPHCESCWAKLETTTQQEAEMSVQAGGCVTAPWDKLDKKDNDWSNFQAWLDWMDETAKDCEWWQDMEMLHKTDLYCIMGEVVQ
jgi:hypothetical protein